MSDNRHPADELADVRNMIRDLKKRGDRLRYQLLDLPAAERAGSRFHAIEINQTRRVIDVDKLMSEIGNLDRFYVNTFFTIVKLKQVK